MLCTTELSFIFHTPFAVFIGVRQNYYNVGTELEYHMTSLFLTLPFYLVVAIYLRKEYPGIKAVSIY